MVQRLMALALLAAAAAACDPTPRARPPTEDTPRARPPTEEPGAVAVYEGLVRYLAEEGGGGWRRVYIAEDICRGAGAAEARGCVGRIAPYDRAELSRRLDDVSGAIEFVDVAGQRRAARRILRDGASASVLVRVGPIARVGTRIVEVPGSYYCGGLCAAGARWRLEKRRRAWRVSEPVDGAWIS
jgi:hypothetical protein